MTLEVGCRRVPDLELKFQALHVVTCSRQDVLIHCQLRNLNAINLGRGWYEPTSFPRRVSTIHIFTTKYTGRQCY